MDSIRRFREARGLTLKEMASDIFVHESTIRGWEHNRRTPNATEIIRIAQTYGVSADYLLGLTEKENRL